MSFVDDAQRVWGICIMRAILTRKTIIIAAISVLIAITTIVSVNAFNSSGPVTDLANMLTRPIRSLASQVAGVFESIYASVYKYDDLMKKHDELLARYNEMVSNFIESDDLARENEQFRALLGFRERHSGYEQELATIEDWSGSNWSSSFIINIGYTNSTIERGNAVVTEHGVLIGQVSDVGAITSTVVSVLDTTFSAGAHIGNTAGSATLKGDFSLMRSGLLMLDVFDEEHIVLTGDSVFTSGMGVFPAGLIVGEVVEVLRHPTGVGRYATVKPLRDLDKTLSIVFVITGFEQTD